MSTEKDAIRKAMALLGLSEDDYAVTNGCVTMSTAVFEFVWGLANAHLEAQTACYTQDGPGPYANAVDSTDDPADVAGRYAIGVLKTGGEE